MGTALQDGTDLGEKGFFPRILLSSDGVTGDSSVSAGVMPLFRSVSRLGNGQINGVSVDCAVGRRSLEAKVVIVVIGVVVLVVVVVDASVAVMVLKSGFQHFSSAFVICDSVRSGAGSQYDRLGRRRRHVVLFVIRLLLLLLPG